MNLRTRLRRSLADLDTLYRRLDTNTARLDEASHDDLQGADADEPAAPAPVGAPDAAVAERPPTPGPIGFEQAA